VAANVRAAASASMWHSAMQGRVATRMNAERIDGSAPKHPGNDAERAQLAALTTRMRARHLTAI